MCACAGSLPIFGISAPGHPPPSPFLFLSPLPTQPSFEDQALGPLPTSRSTLGTLFSPLAGKRGKQSPGGGGWFRKDGHGGPYLGEAREQRRGGGKWPLGLPLPRKPKAQCGNGNKRDCSVSASESRVCMTVGPCGVREAALASPALASLGLCSSLVKASPPGSSTWLPAPHPLPYPKNPGPFSHLC